MKVVIEDEMLISLFKRLMIADAIAGECASFSWARCKEVADVVSEEIECWDDVFHED